MPPEQVLHLDRQEVLVDLHLGPVVALVARVAPDQAARADALALVAVGDASIHHGGACVLSAWRRRSS